MILWRNTDGFSKLRTKKKEHIYQAAMLDPHTGSELDIDSIKKMVDDLIEAHGKFMPEYH